MHIWTMDKVLILIAAYKEHQLEFLDDNACKNEVWYNIVNDMTAALSTTWRLSMRRNVKMDTLKRYYKMLKILTKIREPENYLGFL